MLPASRARRPRQRRAAMACCAWILLVCGPGCSSAPRPHDPADAAYVLDVMPVAWCYEDQPLGVRVDFDCWSRKHKDRMQFPRGHCVYEYTITPDDARPVVLRQTWGKPRQWSGDLKSLPGAPKRLPAGKHTLTIRAVLPAGKVVHGFFVRPFEVRKRELRLSLTSNRAAYEPGQPIVLTGSVENILEEGLDLTGLRMLKVVLRSGGDRLPVKGIRLPDVLRPGKGHRLFQLRFTAGKSDRRFLMGPRAEMTPLPFGLKGKYRVELQMTLAIDRKAPSTSPAPAKPVQRTLQAIPAVATFEIVAAKPGT